MLLKEKASELLVDSNVKRWVDNLNSQSAKRIYLESLAKYCLFRDLTPSQVVEEFKNEDLRKEAEDRLEDFIIENRGKHTPKVVNNLLTGVKSWLKHNNVQLLRRINVGNVRLTPTIDGERPPSQDELRRILGFADLRAKACMSLLAFAGLRPSTLAGLQLKDLPELKIEGQNVDFAKIPAQISVRAQLSKNGRPYQTFLIKEGCDYLKDYLELRLKKGETLTGESSIISFGSRARIKSFSRKAVQRMTKRVFDQAGFKARPYILRSYFATAIDNVRTIPFTHQQFYLGHTGPVEMTYTVHKRLPEWQIEEMRKEFLELEKYLSTIAKPLQLPIEDEKALFLRLVRKLADDYPNIDPMKIRIELAKEKPEFTVDDEIEAIQDSIRDSIRKMTRRTGLTKEDDPLSQLIIHSDELDRYLREGWTYQDQLKDGRIIIVKGGS